MKLSPYILLLALILCGCSSDSVSPSPEPAADETVSFSAYAGKFADTRAGVVGNLGLEDLKKTGFGVFAYSTSTSKYYSGIDNPNFMYNQFVADTAATGRWSYAPLRYWPGSNIAEDGTVTPQYVSFFAYAPYVSAASGTTGITTMSGNATAGDPLIGYTLGKGTAVDLLWGTNEAGSALTDLTLQAPDVKFYFRHALTKIGGTMQNGDSHAGMTIALDVDNNGNMTGTTNAALTTKVTVSKIRLEIIGMVNTATGSQQQALYDAGTLNLNTGKWTFDSSNLTAIDTTGGKSSPYGQLITVPDSAKQLDADATLNTSIAEPARSKYVDDPTLTNGKRLLWDSIPEGVTTIPKNVYAIEAVPLLIIPASGYKPILRISVSYTIRTYDPWIYAGHTDISETLSRTFTLSEEPQPAHRYHIAIRLGLHQLRLDGNIEEWQLTNGSIIFDKASQQWQQGPDIREDDPSGQDTTWMAKPNRSWMTK